MAELSVALIGLNRVSVSIGLALRRYVSKGGKYKFRIVGHDLSPDNEKQAVKLGAIDRAERKIYSAVVGADIVVMALSYDEVKQAYQDIAKDLRDGVVVIDLSPLKAPSLQWADKFLGDEHHLVGATAILNPKYTFNTRETMDEAVEDLFDNSAILITPSVSCIKEAVDLAFNFFQLIGSKPRFLDPIEHDTLLSQTIQLPRLVGTALFYHLLNQPNWDDLKWFTNPTFGALTQPLMDSHPDALRDELFLNRDSLVRGLDGFIQTLQEFRSVLATDDKSAIEAALINTSKEYDAWINARYRADWDAASRPPEPKGGTFMQGLLGTAITDRLTGKKDDD